MKRSKDFGLKEPPSAATVETQKSLHASSTKVLIRTRVPGCNCTICTTGILLPLPRKHTKPTKPPFCKCGNVCAYYGTVGGYSKKCSWCNAHHAEGQRRRRKSATNLSGKRSNGRELPDPGNVEPLAQPPLLSANEGHASTVGKAQEPAMSAQNFNSSCSKCGRDMPPVHRPTGMPFPSWGFITTGYLCECGHYNDIKRRKGWKEYKGKLLLS